MKKAKKLLVLVLAMALIMSVFTGCGKDKKETEDVSSKESEKKVESKQTGDKVLRTTDMSIETLNPHVCNTTHEFGVAGLVYGNLLDLIYDKDAENEKFVPWHAAELPTTEDNKVWTFKLKDDIKWLDGTPINAKDYEYSYKMLLDPKLVNRNSYVFFDDIPVVNAEKYFKGEVEWDEVGIKALDDNTLQITLELPMPEIDVLLAFTGGGPTSPIHKELYEKGMNDDKTETNYATSIDNTPCCGTYKLAEWVRDQYRIFEKNPDDVMADVYTPEKIEQRVITEKATRLQLFESGEIDSAGVFGDDYEKYAEDPRVVHSESTSVWGYYINTESKDNPILANNDLRKALYYGMDRESITKSIYKSVFKPAAYYVPTACRVGGFDDAKRFRDTEEAKALLPDNFGYDPELAKEHFDKAYEANGNKKIEIELIYFEGQEDQKRTAEVTEEQYENLFGSDRIDIKLRSMPFNAAYESYQNRNFEMGIGAMSVGAYNAWKGMHHWTSDYSGKSNTFYNKDFDELYQRTTTGDLVLKPEERIKALAEMEKMLLDFVPQIPIFQDDGAVIYADRVKLATGGEYFPGVGFAVRQSELGAVGQ